MTMISGMALRDYKRCKNCGSRVHWTIRCLNCGQLTVRRGKITPLTCILVCLAMAAIALYSHII